jgi:MIP family channel proteins
MAYSWQQKVIAEAIGTFALVFIGAGAILSLQGSFDAGGTRVAIALAHGLTIAVMVTTFGHISGGHFNPAVTLGVLTARKIGAGLAVKYIASQLLSAALAAAALLAVYPSLLQWGSTNIGNPEPSPFLNEGQVVLVEAILTFFLVIAVMGTGVDKRGAWSAVAGLAIGFTIVLDILMGGPLTGAAMNPARSFGPTLVAFAAGSPTGTALWTNHLLYWVGPALGGVMAGGLYGGLYLREPANAQPPTS